MSLELQFPRTPRTDEEKFDAQSDPDAVYQHGTKWYVPAFFAEQLEREIQELTRDREGLITMLTTPPLKLGDGITARSAGVQMSNYVLKRITE